MANIKSAKKRIRVIAKKTLRNKMIKSQTRTAVKKYLMTLETCDKQEARVALINAISRIDKASSKGIFHKNNASRTKSRLTRLYNKKTA